VDVRRLRALRVERQALLGLIAEAGHPGAHAGQSEREAWHLRGKARGDHQDVHDASIRRSDASSCHGLPAKATARRVV
jgi:hypothetical protein